MTRKNFYPRSILLNQQEHNPFQAPGAYELTTAESAEDVPRKPPNVPLIFAKWFAVCGISAAPSFIFGLAISEQRPTQVAGMLGGVMLFIFVYTVFECSEFGQKLVASRLIRIVSRIGYGIRMVISIVFPIGAIVDIPTGLLSIGTTNFIFGTNIGVDGGEVGNRSLHFIWFLSTTVIQGILLNIILFIFILMMFGIGLLFAGPNNSS